MHWLILYTKRRNFIANLAYQCKNYKMRSLWKRCFWSMFWKWRALIYFREHFRVMKRNLIFHAVFVSKMIMIISHGQGSLERGFPVNEEILQDNLKEKKLVFEQIIYNLNAGKCRCVEVHEFLITPALTRVVVLQNKDTRDS